MSTRGGAVASHSRRRPQPRRTERHCRSILRVICDQPGTGHLERAARIRARQRTAPASLHDRGQLAKRLTVVDVIIGREHVPQMKVIEHALDARPIAVKLIPPLIDGHRRMAVGKEDAATHFFKPWPNQIADSDSASH